MNRYALLVAGGSALAAGGIGLVTIVFHSFLGDHIGEIELAVYAGLIVEIIFFGLVGVSVIVYQESEWRGESVRRRVEKVFANTKINSSALEYIENIIHRNAVYSTETIHKLVVLSYDRRFRAYRVEFHNRYTLKNLFGDLDYNFAFSATIAPDLISDKLSPLGEVISIRLTNATGVHEFLVGKTDLTRDGFVQPVLLTLEKNEKAVFEMEWWSWAGNAGNSGFSIKRFSEKTSVTVENRSTVTVRLFKTESPDEIITVPYRGVRTIREVANVPERTRLDFSWLPPEEYPDDRAAPMGGGVHPVLLRDDKI